MSKTCPSKTAQSETAGSIINSSPFITWLTPNFVNFLAGFMAGTSSL